MFIQKQQVAFYTGGPDAVVQMNGMFAQGWAIKQTIPIHNGIFVIFEIVEVPMDEHEKQKWLKAFGQQNIEYNKKTEQLERPIYIHIKPARPNTDLNRWYYQTKSGKKPKLTHKVTRSEERPDWWQLVADPTKFIHKEDAEILTTLSSHINNANTDQCSIKENIEKQKTLGEEIQEQEEMEERSLLDLDEDEYRLYKTAKEILEACKNGWAKYLRATEHPDDFLIWLHTQLFGSKPIF